MTSLPPPTVLIIGAGFGGLRAARALAHAPVRVVLVDQNNYHLFQPLLYQVATAGLAPEEIAHPVRKILRDQRNLTFHMAAVTGVDFAARLVHTSDGDLAYDKLIIAIGGATHYFGLDNLAQHSLGLKSLDEAVAIRNHVLQQFEHAVYETDADARRAHLTFVIVGGGPSGVESAGALSELIRLVLVKDYPTLSLTDTRILLLEATDTLLAAFPPVLRTATAETLWSKHVEVRFGAAVSDYDGTAVTLKSGELIPAHTLIWAAGIRVAALADQLGVAQGRLGRIRVTPTLQLPDQPDVFAIGDAAHLENDGQALPMVAPVAMQQGTLAAQNILRALNNQPLADFVYHDPGSLATIGRNAAVARLGGLVLRGFPAWVLWLGAHLIQIIGFRSRLMVLINWSWDYFFYDRAIRLITKE